MKIYTFFTFLLIANSLIISQTQNFNGVVIDKDNGKPLVGVNIIGKDFKRLKIGVSHPGRKNEVKNWVLGKFKPAETQLLEELYKKVMVHKDKIFSLEIENLQNLVN